MAVRAFTTSDVLDCSIGGLSTGTFGTLAAIVKRSATGAWHTFLAMHNSGGSALNQFAYQDGNLSALWIDGTTVTGPAAIGTTAWGLVVVRKATGTATPRFSLYNFTTATWTHANASGTLPNWTAPGASATVRFRWETFDQFSGRVAVRGAWNSLPWSADAAGDTALQNAGLHQTLQKWTDAAPTALWAFNQDAVTTAVTDLTGNGANQSARTGTTVVTGDDPPGFSFGGGAIQITLNRAVETDTAGTLSRSKMISVARAVETDAARTLTLNRQMTVSRAVETGLSRSLTVARALTLDRAVETDQGRQLTMRKNVSLSRSTETDAARSLSLARAITLGRATEQNLAFAFTIGGAQIVVLERAIETSSARTFSLSKTVAVARATEFDTARPVTLVRAVSLDRAVELDAARSLTLVRQVLLGRATEIDVARILSIIDEVELNLLFGDPDAKWELGELTRKWSVLMPTPIWVSSLSAEYVRVPVKATEAGAAINPTGNVVEFAFTADPEDDASVWVPGSWETVGVTYYARFLAGSGGADLVPGAYTVWIRVVAGTETPVSQVGHLNVY